MSEQVNHLLNEGSKHITKQAFEAAIKAYEEAISIDPNHIMTYTQLGQAAYLVGKHDQAIRSYLAAMHLELAKIEEQIDTNQLPGELMVMKSSIFTTEQLDKLPARSAFLIFIDPNIPRHFAHAFIDLNPNFLQSLRKDIPKIESHIKAYEAQLIDGNTYLDTLSEHDLTAQEHMQLEESVYVRMGQDLLLNYIRWEYIGSSDVQALYFQ